MPENHGSFTLPARLIRMTGGIEASHDRHKREITAGHTDTSLTHTHTHTRTRETAAENGEASDGAKRQRNTARQATSRNDSEPRRGRRPRETTANHGEAGDFAKRQRTTARQATLRNGGNQRRGRRPRETAANNGEAGDLAKRRRTTARQATSAATTSTHSFGDLERQRLLPADGSAKKRVLRGHGCQPAILDAFPSIFEKQPLGAGPWRRIVITL